MAAKSLEQPMRAPTEVETEDRAVRALTSRLAARYADQYPAAHVAEVIAAARKRFSGAPVRGYVLIFVERAVREALDGPQRRAS
jgi:hypothetical protein